MCIFAEYLAYCYPHMNEHFFSTSGISLILSEILILINRLILLDLMSGFRVDFNFVCQEIIRLAI